MVLRIFNFFFIPLFFIPLIKPANRLADSSETVLETAQKLADDIAKFPQICMRRDRLSAIEQWGLTEGQAISNEFDHGLISLASGSDKGAAEFAKGKGKHGDFK